ncbi:toprim domain-containing protein [Epibacterium sp. MM17-32]|uniref:toprim domain-containing protein n=1 Tax=Epibacterium sp. MM17-32 TaxID=2917734 RepID=UPI001EF4F873|nr:toprim domain-containing protein [Epibacterium sp. MM17-32]MCG7628377.1 toprim domain-containing protein [Epibacterium sp. MM17-32]
MSEDLIPRGEYKAIPVRGLTEETCRKFDYSLSKLNGKRCHCATYHVPEGGAVAQHIRLKGKEFPWIGDQKAAGLFGQQAMRDGPSKLIITEGEIDAMSVWQVINSSRNRWAVVSVKRGAGGAKKDIAEQLAWCEMADEVVLMFDMDEDGIEASKECARLFRHGKAKIASLPLKDANEMLLAERGPEIIDAIFGAKEYRPDNLVKLSSLRERIMTDPVVGMPWWHEGLTAATYGRRFGELDALGAGTGVGKTDYITQQIDYDVTVLGLPVGVIMLEQQPEETGRRLAGKNVGRKFHIPSDPETNEWTHEELSGALDKLEADDRISLYDHFGSADYDKIEDFIRFLYHSEGTRIFYLDHLTALAASEQDERKALEDIMARLGGLVKELDIWVLIISHLATPEGKPHEEGGRVMIRHFKGSRAIGYWCHHMFGLERNQQAEDEIERTTTTLRCLKDRVTGQSTGKTFPMGYEHSTGRLIEKDWSDLDDNPFGGDDDDPF